MSREGAVEEFVEALVEELRTRRPLLGARVYEVEVEGRQPGKTWRPRIVVTVEEEPTMEERILEVVKEVARRHGLVEDVLPNMLRVRLRDGRTVKVTWKPRDDEK